MRLISNMLMLTAVLAQDVSVGNGSFSECPMVIDVIDATFSGEVTAVAENSETSIYLHAGYTGRGHTAWHGDGGKVEWYVKTSQAETTTIKFRYAADV